MIARVRVLGCGCVGAIGPEIGRGAAGTVHRCRWSGNSVAVKIIAVDSELDVDAEDFVTEAESMTSLHHPNLVAFYGAGEVDGAGTQFLVTEFMALVRWDGIEWHGAMCKDGVVLWSVRTLFTVGSTC